MYNLRIQARKKETNKCASISQEDATEEDIIEKVNEFKKKGYTIEYMSIDKETENEEI